MALQMKEQDALPRMALFTGLAGALFAAFNGTGIGSAVGLFLAVTMLAPIAALLVVGPVLLAVRRTRHIRLWASWLLLILSLVLIGATVAKLAGVMPGGA
jgi:hypothetical protein